MNNNFLIENMKMKERSDLSSDKNNECCMKNISPFMSKGMIAAAGFNVETPIVNAIIGNLSGTLPTKKSETEMIKCDICDCELSSNVVLNLHMNGSRHQKRLKALEIMEQLKDKKGKGVHLGNTDNPNAFKCEICSVTVNSAQQLEIHLSGIKHKRKVAKAAVNESDSKTLNKNVELRENSVLNDKRNKDNEFSTGEEDTNKKGMLNVDTIKMLHHWEEFQSFVKKWHPNKDEINKLCGLVEDQCVNYFKDIQKKRGEESPLDRFLIDPPAKKLKQTTKEDINSE